MTTLLISIVACGVSAAGLFWSASYDPKRLRVYGLPRRPRSRGARLGRVLLILVPGAALLLSGSTSAFTVWLGAAGLLGWCVALRQPRAPSI
ncbi:MAG: hypothetical protein AAF933_06930 [Pseudomonadota bacterium]